MHLAVIPHHGGETGGPVHRREDNGGTALRSERRDGPGELVEARRIHGGSLNTGSGVPTNAASIHPWCRASTVPPSGRIWCCARFVDNLYCSSYYRSHSAGIPVISHTRQHGGDAMERQYSRSSAGAVSNGLCRFHATWQPVDDGVDCSRQGASGKGSSFALSIPYPIKQLRGSRPAPIRHFTGRRPPPPLVR